MNTDRDWLLKKAEQEGNCIISVGGFIKDLSNEDKIILLYNELKLIKDRLELLENKQMT